MTDRIFSPYGPVTQQEIDDIHLRVTGLKLRAEAERKEKRRKWKEKVYAKAAAIELREKEEHARVVAERRQREDAERIRVHGTIQAIIDRREFNALEQRYKWELERRNAVKDVDAAQRRLRFYDARSFDDSEEAARRRYTYWDHRVLWG